MDQAQKATMEITDDGKVILSGVWTRDGLSSILQRFEKFSFPSVDAIQFSGENVAAMDTTGAWLLNQLLNKITQQGASYSFTNLHSEHQSLLEIIKSQGDLERAPPLEVPQTLERIGRWIFLGLSQLDSFFAFIGEVFVKFASWFTHPQRVRKNSILSNIQTTGYDAIPIVSLLSFLVGLVLAYQIGIELKTYGANIFIVDLLGLSLLREFAPLLTAIIIAGRTGSAFTAQLGTMKLNEEVDALRTMGLSAIELLVLPRIIALAIALPLLTVLANFVGVCGGMLMAKASLGISYEDFITRFAQVVEFKTYLLGLIKTPVFAVLIAAIGCFQGFQVSGSADSVGSKTTTSVVQGIFMIIVADSVFSVVYSWLGI